MDLNREPTFEGALARELADIRGAGLHRRLRRLDGAQGPRIELEGRECWNFSSNDYLGLAADPLLKAAAVEAVEREGTGSGASRLISGSLSAHHELERALARFKRTEAALTFSSGYATALGTITALVGRSDFIVLDKLVHASIVDAARLSGAAMRVYDHNDLQDLEKILAWAAAKRGEATGERRPRILIVTESVFSMDGDKALLRDLAEIKERHQAWLMVDEAHATGVYGGRGRGLVDELGLSGRVEVQMGTLGKALGSAGGFICGSALLVELLINRARSFIFSTAPSPSVSAAAGRAVQWLESGEGESRRESLWRSIHALSPEAASPIVPLIIGDERTAVEASQLLLEAGFYVPAIRYPSVARGTARLRVTVSATHPPEVVKELAALLKKIR